MEVRILKASGKLGVLAVLGGTLVLSGCVSGTTYGTGVSQEEQTFKDLYNMFSLKSQHKDIAYKPRPETLVVPEEKQLVEPLEDPANAKGADWPESPEERLARIRAEADAAEQDSFARREFDQSAKKFQTTSKRLKGQEAPVGQGIPNVSCDPDGKIMRMCTDAEIRTAVLKRRAELKGAGLNGKRKYLTDPPSQYTIPAATAVAGDAGYTEEELAAIKEREKKAFEEATAD